MSKPRRIYLQEGKILLSGFPREVANNIEAYLARFDKDALIVLNKPVEPEVKQFKDKAVGLRKNNNGHFDVVVIGYDIESKEAQVEEIKDGGDFKAQAFTVFQKTMVEKEIV